MARGNPDRSLARHLRRPDGNVGVLCLVRLEGWLAACRRLGCVVQRRNVFAGRNTRHLPGLDRVGGRGYSALCGIVANGLLSMNEKNTRRRRGWSGLRVSRRMSRHVRATVAVVAISLAVLSQPVQAQDTPSAAQELADLRARAESGDASAQYRLGLSYNLGSGVPQDDAEAVAWYRPRRRAGPRRRATRPREYVCPWARRTEG